MYYYTVCYNQVNPRLCTGFGTDAPALRTKLQAVKEYLAELKAEVLAFETNLPNPQLLDAVLHQTVVLQNTGVK